jgi:hypothetical protein
MYHHKFLILSKVRFPIRLCFPECRQTYIGRQQREDIQATNQAKKDKQMIYRL